MKKYNKTTIMIGEKEVDREKVVLVPIVQKDGSFMTSDRREYFRDKNGTIRRIKKEIK